jgi:hypothetical protein
VPSTNNKGKWIVDEALEEVVDAIERGIEIGTCSLRRATSMSWDIYMIPSFQTI